MANTKVTSAVIEAGAILSTHIASAAITSGHLSGINTAAVAEGTNLYYTDTRARASISVTGGNLSYDNSTGVLQLTDAEIRDAISATSSGDGSLTYTAGTGVIAYTGPSASEVQAHLSAGTGVTYSGGAISIGQAVGTSDTVLFGNITTAGYLRGPANFTIDPAAYGDDTGTLIIAGNLQVDGTTTTINSTTLTVDDLNLTLASGAANAAAANGAGITVDGASATLLYQASGDKFVFNKGLDVTGNIGVTGTVDGRDVAADGTKLDGVEALADVTDATNVTAAGALMDSELTSIASVKAINQGLATGDSPTFAGVTDGYITWGAAQLNRYGAAIELQFTPTNAATLVKIGANGSYPTIFNAYNGNATFSGNIVGVGQILASAGSASAPSISFAGDTNTGIYSGAADNIYVAIGGALKGFWSASQFNVTGNGIFSGNGTFGGTLGVTGAATFSAPTTTLGSGAANTNVELNLNGVGSKATRIQFREGVTPRWLLGQGAATETSAFELYNSIGVIAISVNRTSSLTTLGAGLGVTGSSTFTPSSGENVVITRDSGGPYIGTSSNHSLRLITNNATRISIAATGDVTVPGKILVNTDIRLGSEGVRLSSDGNGEFGVGYGQTATNSRFTVYNNTAAAFRVLPSGNVGIGQPAPTAKLYVQSVGASYSSGSPAAIFADTTSRATVRIRSISDNPSELFFDVNGAARWDLSTRSSAEGYALHLYGQAPTPVYGTVAGPRVTVLQDGKVGLGTPSPATTLEVNGPMSIRSSNYLYFGQSNTSIGTWTTRQYASASSHQFNAQTFSFNRTGYASDELLYMDTNGMYVSPINHGHARMNSLSSTSLAPSAGDWIDIATIPYGRNTAKVKFLWDGVSSPSSAHHGMMEFAIGSHYGTSYYYGWDSYINLLSSSAHNSFHIEEARIITPNGSGATGVFQVRFQGATTVGVWRSYVTERDESCSIQPLTPVVNNSRTGTTIARLDLSAAKGGAVTSRVHMAVSKDLHVQGGITIANQPGFSAYKNASLNEAAANTIIGDWIERYDTGGKFNHTSGRFTATTKGKYLFTLGAMAGQTTGDVQYRINKNGATYANSNSMAQGGGPWRFTTVVATVHLDATDYVDFIAYSNTNTTNVIVYASTFSHVSGHFLG